MNNDLYPVITVWIRRSPRKTISKASIQHFLDTASGLSCPRLRTSSLLRFSRPQPLFVLSVFASGYGSAFAYPQYYPRRWNTWRVGDWRFAFPVRAFYDA
ncbi:hypothetical protein BU26DRAFT_89101 [Trematosphaeria pertusa]|uniref:Uncharacterized protein n=1 Tax=Trematosphaeria pertusa TaxID=390896 RepID=A0A6A6I5R6_9PLEO|nr:uncharacterized protein BU26DRAFT_89101 [Trematosphaeria pertusa]KAF2244910.1 hypothetical protein BU26DRAFT_89101 [Trematosphaeria pertusa]